jgi:hypothetical protein
MGDLTYIAIPGSKTHELPPLLVYPASEHGGGDLASAMPEAEDMLGAADEAPDVVEQRKFELALQLAGQYRAMLFHWTWGDSILEWIRQCEITFEGEAVLRALLHPDVWPHAGRASFVTLLVEKRVPTHGVALQQAVGLRLTFRQPPPIDCCSSQFLLYLNSTVAGSAYETWARLMPRASSLLPPERFHFDVLEMEGRDFG